MQVGKRVICINDVFSPAVKSLYRELPVVGPIYTVRATSLGRDKVAHFEGGKFVPGGASDSVTVRILLQELTNDIDPLHKHGEELGFNAERFREIEEPEAGQAAQAEAEELQHT